MISSIRFDNPLAYILIILVRRRLLDKLQTLHQDNSLSSLFDSVKSCSCVSFHLERRPSIFNN